MVTTAKRTVLVAFPFHATFSMFMLGEGLAYRHSTKGNEIETSMLYLKTSEKKNRRREK